MAAHITQPSVPSFMYRHFRLYGTPILAAGTAPKNSGVAIPNISDGFSGAAPDRGAIIAGRPIPQYGDCSNP